MATAIHGSQVGLLINGFNMTSYFNEFAIDAEQAMHDATVFGNSSRVKVPGLKDGKASGTAFYDSTATVGSYAVLKGLFSSSTPGSPSIASIARCLNSSTFVLGSLVDLIYADDATFESRLVLDDLHKLVVALEADQDGIDYGVSLHALSAETAFPFTGTSVDNTAATTNGGVATLHVSAIAGAAPNVVYVVQHSTDNSNWVDLVTFTATTAANTTQRTEVAAGTTIRRYLRITITEGGTTTSVTGVVIFARR